MILFCASCPSVLSTDEGWKSKSWLEHHEDGSHTYQPFPRYENVEGREQSNG